MTSSSNDTHPGVEVSRAEFCVCAPRIFGGIRARARAHTHTHKQMKLRFIVQRCFRFQLSWNSKINMTYAK